MKSNKLSGLGFKARLTVFDYLKPIKWQLVISAFVILVGFVLGIYFAFAKATADYANEDLLACFITGKMSNLSSMLYRVLSSLFMLLLLWLFSKTKFLMPLALILIFYRAYLLGINIGIMLRFYGLTGIIIAILIILPVQLLLLCYFTVFYWNMLRSCNSAILFPTKKFLTISIIMVLAVNIALALLLMLLSPNVILVL